MIIVLGFGTFQYNVKFSSESMKSGRTASHYGITKQKQAISYDHLQIHSMDMQHAQQYNPFTATCFGGTPPYSGSLYTNI
jgi:hypothetical protein